MQSETLSGAGHNARFHLHIGRPFKVKELLDLDKLRDV